MRADFEMKHNLVNTQWCKQNSENKVVNTKYAKPNRENETTFCYIALENNDVDAVVSFSPGNYFEKTKGSLINKLSNFKKPLFITSSKQEIIGINNLLKRPKLFL